MSFGTESGGQQPMRPFQHYVLDFFVRLFSLVFAALIVLVLVRSYIVFKVNRVMEDFRRSLPASSAPQLPKKQP